LFARIEKTMLHHRTTGLIVLIVGSAMVGCRSKPAGQTQPLPKVVVARAVITPVRDYFDYNGYLDTTETVEVRARVKGLLTAIHFTEGTEVSKGAPLYDIDQREYISAEKKAVADLKKAESDVLNWKAQIRLAEAELERAKLSSKSGVGSKTDLDKAEATLDVNTAQRSAAEASVDAAEATLRTARIQLGYTRISAAIGGRISRTRVTVGNLVGQTEPTLLTTIVRMDELYVEFDAPEVDLVEYQRAMMTAPQPFPELTSRTIDVEVQVTKETGYPHRGKIDFRENKVDTSTGTVHVRGRILNPPGATGARALYPGLYAHVRVPAGEPKPQLALPEDCIMTGQEGRFVYVVKADHTVERRLVTLGPIVWKAPPPAPGEVPPSWMLVNPTAAVPENGPPPQARRAVRSVISILAGLTPEDRVIVDGVQKAQPAKPVESEEWVLQPPGK
jgi:multidrug efflux system membrane fusion protein